MNLKQKKINATSSDSFSIHDILAYVEKTDVINIYFSKSVLVQYNISSDSHMQSTMLPFKCLYK